MVLTNDLVVCTVLLSRFMKFKQTKKFSLRRLNQFGKFMAQAGQNTHLHVSQLGLPKDLERFYSRKCTC